MMFVDIDEDVFVRPIDRGIMDLNQLGLGALSLCIPI